MSLISIDKEIIEVEKGPLAESGYSLDGMPDLQVYNLTLRISSSRPNDEVKIERIKAFLFTDTPPYRAGDLYIEYDHRVSYSLYDSFFYSRRNLRGIEDEFKDLKIEYDVKDLNKYHENYIKAVVGKITDVEKTQHIPSDFKSVDTRLCKVDTSICDYPVLLCREDYWNKDNIPFKSVDIQSYSVKVDIFDKPFTVCDITNGENVPYIGQKLNITMQARTVNNKGAVEVHADQYPLPLWEPDLTVIY